MNSKVILFLDSPSFCKQDIQEAFVKAGFQIQLFYDEKIYERTTNPYEMDLAQMMQKEQPAFVFSFNYFPILSKVCANENVKYVSYVYDSPLSALYSATILNSCNYVFLFDYAEYQKLHAGGIDTVHYLPLAANVKRLDELFIPSECIPQLTSEVSFVGSLYNEKHNLYDRFISLDDHTKGYLEGIMKAQLKVQGCYFVDELLTPEVIDAMYHCCPYEPPEDGVETLQYIYSDYFLARKMTAMERQNLLRAVSEYFELKLYTHNCPEHMPKAKYVGPIDWEESMPAVFRHSKINLNISLRSIKTGIPLRAFDIMGAGGFLLSNYQADFLRHFEAGKDFVYYEDENDMLQKIDYYLSHEKERKEIAQNGHEAVKQCHTFEHRVAYILETISGMDK